MSKIAILALASAASALATAAVAIAEEYGNSTYVDRVQPPSEKTETSDAGDIGTTTKSTRKRGAAATETKTEAPVTETAATEEAPSGKSYEEMREVITPLVEQGRGEEVKKVIAKYSSGGLKELPVDKQAAFIKDVEALTL